MRIKQDGTKMYCPNCSSITVCKSVPLSSLGEETSQRVYRTDHSDIQWFRRGRSCKKCDTTFITAEVNEDFLDELCELRDSLGEIKKNAERYAKESRQASETLEQLSRSLEVLRALDVYQKQ